MADRKERWARVNFPNDHVRAYTMTTKDGRTFDRMTVTIPDGVTADGVDYGGWHLDAFMNSWSRKAKQDGKPVTVSFRPGDTVELWRGRGQSRQSATIDDPWTLCKAVKAHRIELEHEHDATIKDHGKNDGRDTEAERPATEAATASDRGPRGNAPRPAGSGRSDPYEDPGYGLDPYHGDFIGDGVTRTAGGLPYSPLALPDDDARFVVEARLTLDCGTTLTGLVSSTPIPDGLVPDHWRKYTVGFPDETDPDRWLGHIGVGASTHDAFDIVTSGDIDPALHAGVPIMVDGYQETGVIGDLTRDGNDPAGFKPYPAQLQHPLEHFEAASTLADPYDPTATMTATPTR